MEKMVAGCFGEIQPEYGTIFKNISVDPFVDVFKTDFYSKVYYVKSKTKKRKMFLTFLVPAKDVGHKNKTLDYLAFLINYEGRDSLTSYFKKKALALHVAAKIGARCFEGNSMFTFFTIEVSLTRYGYEEMARVVDAIFSFLFIIKVTPMEEHREIFEEFKEIKDTLFKFRKEKPAFENVQELALNMRYLREEDIIVGREICPEFDEQVLKNLIERINDKRFNLMVLSDNYPKYNKIEKWFGTEYTEIGEKLDQN